MILDAHVLIAEAITSYFRIIFTPGDYNTAALIFKMVAARFLDVFEETNKMKQNAVALIISEYLY